jgi:zinc transporter 6
MWTHGGLVCTVCALHLCCSCCFAAEIAHQHDSVALSEDISPYQPHELKRLIDTLLPQSTIEYLNSKCDGESDIVRCLHMLTESTVGQPPISQPTFNKLSVVLLCAIFKPDTLMGESQSNYQLCMSSFTGDSGVSSSELLHKLTTPESSMNELYQSHCSDSSFEYVVQRTSLETTDEFLEFAGAVILSLFKSGCWHLKPTQGTFTKYYIEEAIHESYADLEMHQMFEDFGSTTCTASHVHIDHCYSADVVLASFNISPTSLVSSLSEQSLLDLCPALLYRALNPSCRRATHHDDVPEGHDSDSRKIAYLYGTVAITVCSLLALLGIPLVLIDRNSASVQMLLQGLIGLAVSSMAGDAILHLWPQAVGLHKPHGSGGHEVDVHAGQESGTEDRMFLWKSLAVLGSLYLFFVFETLMHQSIDHRHTHSLASEEAEGRRRDRHHDKHHSHDHHHHHEDRYSLDNVARPSSIMSLSGRPPLRMSLCTDRERTYSSNCIAIADTYAAVSEKECKPRPETILSVTHNLSNSYAEVNGAEDHNNGNHNLPPVGFEKEQEVEDVPERTKFGIPEDKFALVTMLIMGDMFHNLSDGLAVGAAFSNGVSSGMSTSIAVLCHELPHELGDFAILYDCGLNLKSILILNFISSIASFVGLYVGVAVSASFQGSYEWIFAVTAGMFLYVAFIDMLPQMMHVSSNYPWLVFLVQNTGLVTGFVAMLVLALLE